MKTKTKFIIISVLFAIISFGLTRVIWPDVGGMATPTASQLPLFMFIGAWECVAFGIGVAFIFLGWKYLKNLMPEEKMLTMWTFVSIAWMLVSWWPHDNMHRVNGADNLSGLLKIEYIFHFTLVLAAFIGARYFWKLITKTKVS